MNPEETAVVFYCICMDSFETIKQHGSDILFTLHDFDPPITPVNDHSATTGLNGAKIIEHVLQSVRVKNAASEVCVKLKYANA